jgi:hypothetical protein
MSRRREQAAAGVLALAALAGWALVRTYPSYDSYASLVWGRELLDGALPAYGAPAAPTPHPLWILVSAAAGLAGRDGERVLVLVTVLAWVALLWGIHRLGAALWDRPRGLLAAGLAAASASLALWAAQAYLDVLFAALVAWAGAAWAERRGRAALVLLALAGLLRPEAWVLGAGAWWFGRPRRRVDLALVLAAPVLWILTDLIVTGDPLWSLNRTASVVRSIDQEVGAGALPARLVSSLAGLVTPPVLVLGVGGVALAAWRRQARAWIPGAAIAVGIVAWLAGGVLSGAAERRYLLVPALGLCLFAAHLVLGFRDEPAGGLARWWRRGALAAAALAVVGVAVLLPGRVRNVTDELAFVRHAHDDLETVLASPSVRPCRPIVFPTYRLVPVGRWALDRSAAAVRAADRPFPPGGVRVFVAGGDKPIRRFGIASGTPFSTNAPDPKVPAVAAAGPFTARGRCR